MKQQWFVMMAAVALSAGVASAALTLVDGGKSDYSIVIPAKPPESVSAAADELQKDIHLATGAQLPIIKDDKEFSQKFISLGLTRPAKAAGLSAQSILDSGYHIVTRNDNLYIIGLDTVARVKLSRQEYGMITPQPDIPGPQYTKDGGFSNGTANGVYTFLENHLDVRWLMPGEIGRDVPRRNVFTIEEIDRTESPVFVYRDLSYLNKDYKSSDPKIAAWMYRQKLGSSYRLNSGHNWRKVVPASLYKDHPDWFPMIGGKHPKPTGRYKLETTNPELVRYFAEAAVKAFKEDPHLNTFSLSPSDSQGWSESPAAKALYGPPSPSWLPKKRGRSLTPLILKWYRDVSDAVARKYPQGRLAGYFYSSYIFPPEQNVMTLPENFVPVIAPSFDYGYTLYREDVRRGFDQVMSGWAKLAPSTWFYYDLPNQLTGDSSVGTVTPPATEILDFIFPRLLKYHLNGTQFYGSANWSNTALANYIGAKLLWNPKLNALDLRDEWLDRAYGEKAGVIMQRFYNKLNAAFADYYRKNRSTRYHAEERMFEHLFGPAYPELERLYLEAESQPMTGNQKRRLHLIRDNLIVLQWRLRNGGNLPKSSDHSPLKRTDPQIVTLLFPQKRTLPFEEFPIDLWAKNQPRRTVVNVVLNPNSSGRTKSTTALNNGYILLYPTQDMTLTIHPTDVHPGSAFLGYRIYEQKETWYHRVAQGLLYSDGMISFPAKAKVLYYLRIAPQGIVPQSKAEADARYRLDIPGAVAATGSYDGNTLQLNGKKGSLYIFASSKTPLSIQDNSSGVTIRTQAAADAERAGVMKRHPNLKLLQTLDDGWLFQTDSEETGKKRGYASAGFNDDGWSPITTLDWWQNQGFEDYHGTAWYRKTFDLSNFKPDQKAVIFFGAIDGDAVIYLNDQKIGEHLPSKMGKGWDAPFYLPATSLKAGRNVLAAEVTKNQYMSGIYRGVSLLVDNP